MRRTTTTTKKKTTPSQDFHCNCVTLWATIVIPTATQYFQESHNQHKILCPLASVKMHDRQQQLQQPAHQLVPKSIRRKRKRHNLMGKQQQLLLVVLVCAILIQQVSLLSANANQKTIQQRRQQQLVKRSIEGKFKFLGAN